MGVIKAIETQYKGHRFRSRTEARWAVFFDTLGTKWEYEKEGYDLGEHGWYLPDFWLPQHKLWVEVKGEFPTEIEQGKAQSLADSTGSGAVIVGSVGEVFAEFGRTPADNADFIDAALPSNYWINFLDSTERADSPEGWGIHLGCPLCGNDYIHFGKANEKSSDDYVAWQGRGGALRIPMYCESGCSWTLRMGFHKGFTYLDVEDAAHVINYSTLEIIAGRNAEALQSAIIAARSARFEHGEKPNVHLPSSSQDEEWCIINPLTGDRLPWRNDGTNHPPEWVIRLVESGYEILNVPLSAVLP